jgi:hypothetical protein
LAPVYENVHERWATQHGLFQNKSFFAIFYIARKFGSFFPIFSRIFRILLHFAKFRFNFLPHFWRFFTIFYIVRNIGSNFPPFSTIFRNILKRVKFRFNFPAIFDDFTQSFISSEISVRFSRHFRRCFKICLSSQADIGH